MSGFSARLPVLTYVLLSLHLLAVGLRLHNDTTFSLIVASLLMFACCWASAAHLLGGQAALRFVAIALAFGWFAEQMGSTQGWFFGHYTYTEVLGPRLGNVPVIIPLMWFALTYAGYVIANLIVWQAPAAHAPNWGGTVVLSFLAAMIVTAYDLGADPYLVYVLEAWIMTRADGDWFGETVQGFVGWTFVGLSIILAFRLTQRLWSLPTPRSGFSRRDALVPLAIYGGSLVFQVMLGYPVETRSVAFFAMGIPLLGALAGWQRWQPRMANTPSSPPSPINP